MKTVITIVARCRIRPGCRGDYIRRANDLVTASRAEEGNLSYTLFEDLDDPEIMCFIEEWRDRAAVEAHNASAHVQNIVPELRQMRVDGCSETHLFQKAVL